MNCSQTNFPIKDFCLCVVTACIHISIRGIRLRSISKLNNFIVVSNSIQLFLTPECIKRFLHYQIKRSSSVKFSTIWRNHLDNFRIAISVFIPNHLLPEFIECHACSSNVHAGMLLHISNHNICKNTLQLFLFIPEIHSKVLINISIAAFKYLFKETFFLSFQSGTLISIIQLLMLLNKDFSKIQNAISVTLDSIHQLSDVICQRTNVLWIFCI